MDAPEVPLSDSSCCVLDNTTLGFFCSPLERVNLASKSRSGAPLGSLSDLLKGLAPGSRNANQPTGPNLTSSILPTLARALSKSTITLQAALAAARHQLFIIRLPSGRNQTPPAAARHGEPGPWPWPQGLGHRAAPAQDPARGAFLSSERLCTVLSAAQSSLLHGPSAPPPGPALLVQTPGRPADVALTSSPLGLGVRLSPGPSSCWLLHCLLRLPNPLILSPWS